MNINSKKIDKSSFWSYLESLILSELRTDVAGINLECEKMQKSARRPYTQIYTLGMSYNEMLYRRVKIWPALKSNFTSEEGS